jgi:D-alanyl-D-alanine carboxypeptidase/D-alanyl-D-alanine-endopeptidase (penicillin-binding protein 4)
VLRVIGAVLFVLGAASALAGFRYDEPAAGTTRDTRAARTAFLSARRAPFVFVEAVGQQRLASELRQLLAPYHSCVAVEGPTDTSPNLRMDADAPFAPASTLKLLTGAAALATLGPEHTFTTRAVLSDDGTLTVIGSGDPVLTTPEYEARLRGVARTHDDPATPFAALADAIVANGVRSITAIRADDSRHDAVRFLPDWKPSYVENIGALGALTVDDGTARGTRAGDPGLNAAEQLRALLVANGVIVGGVERGTAPPGAREVGSVRSPPLADIVAGMLTSSDNLTAEMLTREIGLARGGDGSTPAGTRAALRSLRDLGIPTDHLDLRDGSGLAVADRVTCDAVLGVLSLHGARFAALDKGLPVAGRTGTLATRLQNDPLAGVLRAKTGNLDTVASLAGVVDDNEHLRFAFVVNDNLSTAQGRDLADEVARVVARYPDSPPVDELVPPP